MPFVTIKWFYFLKASLNGRLKTSCCKIRRLMAPTGLQIENCLKILLDFEIFEKGHSKPELRMIKVWSQIIVLFAMFYTNPSLFLAFTVFTSIVYFFWLFPFQPPPLRKSKTPAWFGQQFLTQTHVLDFLRGVK